MVAMTRAMTRAKELLEAFEDAVADYAVRDLLSDSQREDVAGTYKKAKRELHEALDAWPGFATTREVLHEENVIRITVWRFDDAPSHYRALSEHGGDEDWLAFVPEGFGEVPWLRGGSLFGPCEVSMHEVTSGVVHIGAHA